MLTTFLYWRCWRVRKQSFNFKNYALYYIIIMKLDKTNLWFSFKAPWFSQRYQIYCTPQSLAKKIKAMFYWFANPNPRGNIFCKSNANYLNVRGLVKNAWKWHRIGARRQNHWCNIMLTRTISCIQITY